MLHDILFAIWFLLPIAYANMAPIFAAAMPGLKRWDAALDCGRTFRGKPLLGPHKTWRGIIAGMLLATLVLWLQQLAVRHYGWAASIGRDVPYSTLPTLILGPLFGLGALGGDAIESFFKRQLGKKSGESWKLFDQIDFIIGALLASSLVIRLSLIDYLMIVIIGTGGHLLTSYLGWLAGLKERPI